MLTRKTYGKYYTLLLMWKVSCVEEKSHERAWTGFKYLLRRGAHHFTNYLYSTDHSDKCGGLVTSECCGIAYTTSSIHMLK